MLVHFLRQGDEICAADVRASQRKDAVCVLMEITDDPAADAEKLQVGILSPPQSTKYFGRHNTRTIWAMLTFVRISHTHLQAAIVTE